ncbi:MAG: GYF domain-containing protein [Planctomycetota bacterium]|nr:GYF domain-containing protein [Planctomycetota bacterium]
MGIRFRCPNGHKLNVKTFQTGMRGICPYCGAKFTVPAESTLPPSEKPQPAEQLEDAEQAGELGDTGQPPPQPVIPETTKPPPPAQQPSSEQPAAEQPARTKKPQPADPLTEEPDTLWYVRPPSGGQFGPAGGDVMRQWIKDGRVTADSLVWREGWQDWVEAVTVFPRLALVRWLPDDDAKKPPPPPKPRPQKPSPARPGEEAQSIEAPKAVGPFVESRPDGERSRVKSEAAKRGGGRRRPRSAREIKQRRVNLVIGLSVLAVAMAGILTWVLLR